MTFQQQPPALVDNQGRVAFGVFPETVANINGRAADYRTPMGKPASSFARHFHYKQFQYFGVVSDELLRTVPVEPPQRAWAGAAAAAAAAARSRRGPSPRPRAARAAAPLWRR